MHHRAGGKLSDVNAGDAVRVIAECALELLFPRPSIRPQIVVRELCTIDALLDDRGKADLFDVSIWDVLWTKVGDRDADDHSCRNRDDAVRPEVKWAVVIFFVVQRIVRHVDKIFRRWCLTYSHMGRH